jgi:hypothetical protein
MPSAARMARNDSTVVGFVSVKRNVDLKSEYALARSCVCAFSGSGRLKKYEMPMNDQQNAAEKANPELFPDKELDDECDAEARDTAVQHVGRRRSEAGDHARLPSPLERPVNAQDIHRSHGHRNHQPDDYAPYQQLDFSHSPATTSNVRVLSVKPGNPGEYPQIAIRASLAAAAQSNTTILLIRVPRYPVFQAPPHRSRQHLAILQSASRARRMISKRHPRTKTQSLPKPSEGGANSRVSAVVEFAECFSRARARVVPPALQPLARNLAGPNRELPSLARCKRTGSRRREWR